MPRTSHRIDKLSPPQQIAFLQEQVPGRISSIRYGLQQPTYPGLAVAAIFSRAIAGFLGIGVRGGHLAPDKDYFIHVSPDSSWVVKITDVGGEFVDFDRLSSADKSALEEGINETNRAFAHLTFWNDPSSQDADGLATGSYTELQCERIRRLADTVISLFEKHAANANPA
jgi:hypothetical protein